MYTAVWWALLVAAYLVVGEMYARLCDWCESSEGE